MLSYLRNRPKDTNIIDVGCGLVFILLATFSSNELVESLGISLGVVTALLINDLKTKRIFFFGITLLLALLIAAAWLNAFRQPPFQYLSGKLVHNTCAKYLGNVGSGYIPIDEDGDGFLEECEEHSAGDDQDATRIPELRSRWQLWFSDILHDSSSVVRPSFIDQKTRECRIAADARSFEIFHVGIPHGSASGYVISFQGGRQECHLTTDDRKQHSFRCAFDHNVSKGFAELSKGHFDLSVSVLRVDGGTESFQYDCQKI